MSPKLAAFDRLLLALLGLIALVSGSWGILAWIGIEPILSWTGRLDFSFLSHIPKQRWYQPILLAISILLLLAGLWLSFVNLRRHGFNRVRSQASTTEGTIELSLGKIAAAAGMHIAASRDVIEVSQRVALDRRRPTIAWTIIARPHLDLPALGELLEQVEHDVRDAIEDIDVDTVYRLHLRPVQQA